MALSYLACWQDAICFTWCKMLGSGSFSLPKVSKGAKSTFFLSLSWMSPGMTATILLFTGNLSLNTINQSKHAMI